MIYIYYISIMYYDNYFLNLSVSLCCTLVSFAKTRFLAYQHISPFSFELHATAPESTVIAN